MEDKKKGNITPKTTRTSKETVKEVAVDNTDETEVVAREVSEDVSKKPTKGKRSGKRRSGRKSDAVDKPEESKTTAEQEIGQNESVVPATDQTEGDVATADTGIENMEETLPEDNAAGIAGNKVLELELEKQKTLVEEANDRYKRLLAEFENARNRNEKESKKMYDVGAKEVLERLLPVVDNFERALQAIPDEDRERAFEQGVDKIYKQLIATLDEVGVKPMNAEGTEFDPNLHNAVMHIEDEAFGDNVVAEELQKGYMYK